MDWLDVITRFVLPPILGALGGLVVIWAQWGIAKKRHRLQYRTDLILSWRLALVPLINQSEPDWSNHRARVLATPEYASLRSHLSRRVRKKFEAERAAIISDGHRTRMVVDEIARIERKWQLV
jgi:hypothetical protein